MYFIHVTNAKLQLYLKTASFSSLFVTFHVESTSILRIHGCLTVKCTQLFAEHLRNLEYCFLILPGTASTGSSVLHALQRLVGESWMRSGTATFHSKRLMSLVLI